MAFFNASSHHQSARLETEFHESWSDEGLPEAMEALATPKRCHRGQGLYGREEPVEYWYRVMSGMMRKTAIMSDGRRRIVDFLLPGDFFGFSAQDERDFDVEAVIEGTVLACYPRHRIEVLADSDVEVGRHVRRLTVKALCRLQSRILVLGHTTSLEKVNAFLIEMGQRNHEDSSPAVVLPMSRYDIADYLALSVETVSRALTTLTRRGSISLVDKHHVMLADRDASQAGQGIGLH
jgi:CRP/FNR family nitrogen fixation transcriptional regulator